MMNNNKNAAAAIIAMRTRRGSTAQRQNQKDELESSLIRMNEAFFSNDETEEEFYQSILSGKRVCSTMRSPRRVAWNDEESSDDEEGEPPDFADNTTSRDDEEYVESLERELLLFKETDTCEATPLFETRKAQTFVAAARQEKIVVDKPTVSSDFSDSDDDDDATMPISTSAMDDLDARTEYPSEEEEVEEGVHELGLAAKAPPLLARRISRSKTAAEPVVRPGRSTTTTTTKSGRRRRTTPQFATTPVAPEDDDVIEKRPSRLVVEKKQAALKDFGVLGVTPGQRLRIRPRRR